MYLVEASPFLTSKIFKDSCFCLLTRSLRRKNLLCFYARLKVLKWIFTIKTYLIHTGLGLGGEKKTRIEEEKIGTICFLSYMYVAVYVCIHTCL